VDIVAVYDERHVDAEDSSSVSVYIVGGSSIMFANRHYAQVGLHFVQHVASSEWLDQFLCAKGKELGLHVRQSYGRGGGDAWPPANVMM